MDKLQHTQQRVKDLQTKNLRLHNQLMDSLNRQADQRILILLLIATAVLFATLYILG